MFETHIDIYERRLYIKQLKQLYCHFQPENQDTVKCLPNKDEVDTY